MAMKGPCSNVSACPKLSLAELKASYQQQCLIKSCHTPVWEERGNIIIPILQIEETEALKQIHNWN